MTDNSLAADILAVMGATGSGKSSAICAKLTADEGPRRLVYDPGEDFGAFGTVTESLTEIHRAVIVERAPAFRFVYRPSIDLRVMRGQFDAFCRLAYVAGDVLVVADELQDVMLPSWAPPWWCALVRKGRKRGVRIVAASQRPAGIEKGFWSMATVVRSGRLNYLEDARTVAAVLMVDPLRVMALPPLHWLQRSIYRPVIAHGRIEWRGGAPRDVLLDEKPLPGAPAA